MFIGLLLALVVGFGLGRWSVRHHRRDRIAYAQRRLQLKVLSLELKGLRQKVVSAQGRRTAPANRKLVRKLPTLKWWQRRLIGWLRPYFPWLTRFMRFSPGTYIRWRQAKARAGHARKIAEGKARVTSVIGADSRDIVTPVHWPFSHFRHIVALIWLGSLLTMPAFDEDSARKIVR